MPMLAARWGHAQTYLLASLGLALSLLPLALAPHWGAAGLGFMGVIALASISRPASMVYQMELVTQGWRVAIASAGTTAVGLSWAIMAVGGGSLIPLLGYRAVFALGALISGAGACLFWAGFLRPRRRLTQPPALQVADEPTHVG
jgi:predicted MFS family arabinose efflux permease